MPQPLPDELREAILADIRDGVLGCRAIARKHQVSPSSVSNLAKVARVDGAFERAQTQKAREAATFDAKAARTLLIEQLYGDAQRFRARAWSPYTQLVSGPHGPELVTTKLPPIREQQSAYTAIAIALDKALKLERADDDGGAAQGRTMVNDLFGALELAWHQIVAEDAAAAGEVDLTAPMEPVDGGEAR